MKPSLQSARPLDVLAHPLRGFSLVEASAGTGKTWTLAALYARFIAEHGLEPGSVLAVTYTRSAAAELEGRVRRLIVGLARAFESEAGGESEGFVAAYRQHIEQGHARDAAGARLAPEVAAERLRRAMAALDEAAVYTIHGFCQRALSETPFSSRRPFARRIVEDDSPWIARAAADFWRRRVAGGTLSPHAIALLGRELAPESLAAELRVWLAKPFAQFRTGGGEPAAFDAYVRCYERARELWSTSRGEIVGPLLAPPAPLPGRVFRKSWIETCVREWELLLEGPWARFPREAKEGAPDPYRFLRAEFLRTEAPALDGSHEFYRLADRLRAKAQAAREGLAALRARLVSELFAEAAPQVRDDKRRARVLAFDDMLEELRRALVEESGERLAESIRARYPVALVDEFQDTDPLQYDVLWHIWGQCGAPLVLVGDPKQSIYRFRNADLPTYLAARERACSVATLDENRRSSPDLVSAVNRLFTRHPDPFALAGLQFRKAQAVQSSGARLEPPPRPALRVLWLERAQGKAPTLADARRRAAQAAAAEVARLVGLGEKGALRLGARPLAPGDVAVLVRRHAEGELMRRELARLGLGAAQRSQESVYESVEAKEALCVVAALADPSDDGLVRAALATRLAGWNAVQIAQLDGDEALAARQKERFRRWRAIWQERGFAACWAQILAECQSAERLLGEEGGERALTNYRHLGELVHATAREAGGIEPTLARLEAAVAEPPVRAEAAQLRLESDEALPQVVTVHAAKGLGYPVVLCPFAFLPGSARGAKPLEYHDADGAVVDYAPKPEAEARAREEDFAEELRLLYVALTRAEHALWLVAGCPSYGRDEAAGRASALNWLVAGSGALRDWLANPPPEDEIRAAWEGCAEGSAGAIGFEPLAAGAAPALAADESAGEDRLRALRPMRELAESWRLWSFTSLWRGKDVTVDEQADRDEAVAHDAADPPPQLAEDDVLRLERGPQAGLLVHAVLAAADFAQPEANARAIEEALARYHPAKERRVYFAMLEAMLRAVSTVRLDPVGASLSELDARAMWREFAFWLAAPRAEATALARLLACGGVPFPEAAGALQGYLRGSMDLVFRHRGCWWILDWKSNFLGYAQADYEAQALGEVMQAEGYLLQQLLYTVALHRHLRHREPAYRYGAHFGGVLYVFVRGLRPQWPGAGLWFHRPSEELVAELDALLGGAAGGAQ